MKLFIGQQWLVLGGTESVFLMVLGRYRVWMPLSYVHEISHGRHDRWSWNLFHGVVIVKNNTKIHVFSEFYTLCTYREEVKKYYFRNMS